MQKGTSVSLAAAKSGMDEKTARKYHRGGRLPSECQPARDWRTRPDPFDEVWAWSEALLKEAPGLEAKSLFDALQRKYPGRFPDGQVRTFQRRVKNWRALEGPAREVFFPQQHHAGELSQSDFTSMRTLKVTIAGQPFDHLVYHFVLTYSNWETGTICFSESFESLSAGLENALRELGGSPRRHRTDQLSAAVHQMPHRDQFTRRYQALLGHYGVEAEHTGVACPNENGDVEQSHNRFKRAVEQALLLRGSRDFLDRSGYERFLREIFGQRNAGRKARFEEERAVLRPLPVHRLEMRRRIEVRVGQGSTIRVLHNAYSVHSRLIGETVTVRLGAEDLEIWYGQRQVDQFPRLRGEKKHRIDYRHVIDWLVRKPGAFAEYRYREDLFPTSRFRMAYDQLVGRDRANASREYLAILQLAATVSETGVDEVLRQLIQREEWMTGQSVEHGLRLQNPVEDKTEVAIDAVDLACYDELLEGAMEAGCEAVVN
ncbi:MAG: IS21 family transposase [Candidatus Eisenbacteria bacterium]|nr:IS21 family transposase [Candidatus Eisenbacteria bacterium]